MKHLFSSGEIMYKKNEKKLPEGVLYGSHLEYEGVESDTMYECTGTLNEKDVKVIFSLSDDEFDGVKSRYVFKILMQSDIFLADWKSYEIVYTD